ncbi:universal stress protein [Halobellus ruber]|uniref:universal stress protein n=1 Tax=Halobellus ruber TaxID=2761102 RepID=UPI0031B605AC
MSDDDRYRAVLDVAVELASGLGQKLYVTHLVRDAEASAEERTFRDEIRTYLSDTAVPVEINLEYLDRGSFRSGTAVGKQLGDFTTDVGVDHIVLGHRSKDRLSAIREGHTGFVVAEEAAVPVTIVPEAVTS